MYYNKSTYHETWKWLVIKILCMRRTSSIYIDPTYYLTYTILNHFHTDLKEVSFPLGFNHETVRVFLWFLPSVMHCNVWGYYSLPVCCFWTKSCLRVNFRIYVPFYLDFALDITLMSYRVHFELKCNILECSNDFPSNLNTIESITCECENYSFLYTRKSSYLYNTYLIH